MDGMTDPIAFGKARLAEDKAGATAASFGPDGAPWTDAVPGMVHIDAHWISQQWSRSSLRAFVAGSDTDVYRQHIARYDPDRALREVEAGLRILARHKECAKRGAGPCWEFPVADGLLCAELADLLFRWADHVEYEPAWLPDEEA